MDEIMSSNHKLKKVTMYHVSPVQGIKRLRPTGGHRGDQVVPQNGAGVYVSPSMSTALFWATMTRTASYKLASVYRLQIPKFVIARSWNCEREEYFIREKDMKYICIISEKRIPLYEAHAAYHRRYEINREQENLRAEKAYPYSDFYNHLHDAIADLKLSKGDDGLINYLSWCLKRLRRIQQDAMSFTPDLKLICVKNEEHDRQFDEIKKIVNKLIK